MLDVGQYYGEMNVDSWMLDRWREELSSHHVLVMTHTIFKNMLHCGFIHLKNVNLLVFDECHHAVKKHDYAQIMQVFDSCTPEQYPRILGLSASLLPSKCKPGDLERKVKELEKRLKCRCQTAGEFEEVTKYATNPDEETLPYSAAPLPHLSETCTQLRHTLQQPLEFLNNLPKAQRNESCCRTAKVSLDDCLHILDNLGVWSAIKCAEESVDGLMSSMELLEPLEKALLGLSITHLNIFAKRGKEISNIDEIDVTHKVQLLISCLSEQLSSKKASLRVPNNNKKAAKMLGIVFVERRMTAFLLSKMLKTLAQNPQSNLSSIKCDYIVGHNDTKGLTSLRKETHMNVRKQHETLEKFRKGKINLLFATSVVEEGLDIPKCNLVIRFDFPPNIRSYIQSKGRARAKPSKYILFIEEQKEFDALRDLENYRFVEEELRTFCLGRNPPDNEEFLVVLEKEERNIYAPYGREAGIRATLGSSLSLLYK